MSPQASPVPSNDDLVGMIAAVGLGDEPAFAELYASMHVRLTRVANRALQAPDHVAEVVQEVFAYVWEHATSFDPARGTALAWLSMLAHRRSVDRIRHVQRSAVRDQLDAERCTRPVEDCAELGLARIEATQVHAALHQLSRRQRDALVLTFLHGHSNAEAAQLLGIPLGTLKSRVREGLIRLRDHVEPLAG